jgi:hypothetical protein
MASCVSSLSTSVLVVARVSASPHVLVFDYNDYWRADDRRAMPLGVYTWDAGQEDWRLLSRGPIPLD